MALSALFSASLGFSRRMEVISEVLAGGGQASESLPGEVGVGGRCAESSPACGVAPWLEDPDGVWKSESPGCFSCFQESCF